MYTCIWIHTRLYMHIYQHVYCSVSPKKISCLAFTHDEAYVVAANKFGDVLVAPTAPQTGSTEYEQFIPLMGHFCSIITSVGMSSLLKPQLLSTSDRDGRIRVSVVPEEPMKGAHEIQSYCFGHTNFVSSAVFLVKENKDEVLLSGSGDGTMKMWDPMTGQCIQSVVIPECGIVPHDCDDANGLVVLDLIPSHDRQTAVALIDGTTTCIHVSLQHGTFTMKPIKLNLPVVSDAAVDADGQYWFVGGPIGQNGVQCVRGMISSEGEWTEIPTVHDGYSEFEARTEGDEPLSLCHLPKYLFRVPFSDGDAP